MVPLKSSWNLNQEDNKASDLGAQQKAASVLKLLDHKESYGKKAEGFAFPIYKFYSLACLSNKLDQSWA